MLIALVAWASPIHVTSAQTKTASLPEAIIQPSNASNFTPIQEPTIVVQSQNTVRVTTRSYSGRHSTRAEKQISVEQLQQYLSAKGSPLAIYSRDILASPYWSTIIGICTIEQYSCTRAPGNNYWGIGPGKRFADIPAGISAISNLLASYDAKGKDTLEELNGFYVVPASANWYNTVLTTKLKLESLTSQ